MSLSIPESGYYVYILARPNGNPFYVGKGKGKRIFAHEREAQSGHKCYKCNVIRKVWRQGQNIEKYIVFTTEDEREALAYEVELIALHGRDILVNRTDGGDGARNIDDETRAKRVAAQKKRFSTPEHKQRRSEAVKKRWQGELREKYNNAVMARRNDPIKSAHQKALRQRPEIRANLSEKIKTLWQDPEYREVQAAKIKKGMQTKWEDPAFRARVSDAARQRWADPETRKKLMERLEETNDTRRAAVKASWADPEKRAKRIAAMVKGRWGKQKDD